MWNVGEWGQAVRQDSSRAWVRDEASLLRDGVLSRGSFLPCVATHTRTREPTLATADGEAPAGSAGAVPDCFWTHLAHAACDNIAQGAGAGAPSRAGPDSSLELVLAAQPADVCSTAMRFLLECPALPAAERVPAARPGRLAEGGGEVLGARTCEGASARAVDEGMLLMWLLAKRVWSSTTTTTASGGDPPALPPSFPPSIPP